MHRETNVKHSEAFISKMLNRIEFQNDYMLISHDKFTSSPTIFFTGI